MTQSKTSSTPAGASAPSPATKETPDYAGILYGSQGPAREETRLSEQELAEIKKLRDACSWLDDETEADIGKRWKFLFEAGLHNEHAALLVRAPSIIKRLLADAGAKSVVAALPLQETCPSCQAGDHRPYIDAQGQKMRACGRCMIQWVTTLPASSQ